MVGGIKTLPDGDYCAYCNIKVNSSYNFCPRCGSTLNDNARKLKEQQEKRMKLEVYNSLADQISDKESLQIIVENLKNL